MYMTIAEIQRDPYMRDRVSACVAVEWTPSMPESWVASHSWELATQPGWAAAWESAVASHPDDEGYRPGADEAVITDGMILSAVQSITRAGEPDAVEGS